MNQKVITLSTVEIMEEKHHFSPFNIQTTQNDVPLIRKINNIFIDKFYYFLLNKKKSLRIIIWCSRFQFSSKMTQNRNIDDAQIQAMLKQKVVDLEEIVERRGFVYNFLQLAQNNFINLTKNIFGDFSYERRNMFSVANKRKILDYLKEKYLLLSNNLAEQNKKNYYNYDPNFFQKQPKDLNAMKEMVLQGKSQVEAAQSNLQRLKASRDYIRAQFLNQAAFQFDRQRYCSIYWGILAGSLINATIYKRGRTARKAALLITIAHVFGQISYHLNLDKYFDSVYAIFEEQAEVFISEQKKAVKASDKVWIKNQIQS